MPELGRAALIVALGLSVYALVAGRLRRLPQPPPPRRVGAERAPRGLRRGRGRLGRARGGARPRRLPLRLRRRAHVARPAAPVRALGLLGRPGGLAPPLAARPHGLLGGRDPVRAAPRPPRARRLGHAPARRRRRLLLLPRRRDREPVRHAGRAGGRRRHDAEPPEPVHARPPAAPLPRLRRPDHPLGLRDGRRCSPGARTSAGSWPRAAGRSAPGRSSASASCSARTGPTRRWAGAATTRGTRSRTPR